MIFNYESLEPKDRYRLISQSVVPRAIAWIVTQNSDYSINLAPFSYFTPLSSNPPTLIVSIGHKMDGTPKDTLRNIRESGKCVICIPSKYDLEALHYTSKNLEYGESETEHFGIDTVNIFDDFPPVVKGSNSAFACKLFKEINLDGGKTIPLILKIEAQFIPEDLLIDKERLTVEFDILGRGSSNYIVTLQEYRLLKYLEFIL